MPGIILADRDTRYASILRNRFEMSGVPFSFLSDGKALPSLAREMKPNVVVCSLRIEYMDGFEAMQQMREDESLRTIPCIVLTDLADRSDICRCRALGCVAYFIKRHTKPEYLFAYLLRSGYLLSESI